MKLHISARVAQTGHFLFHKKLLPSLSFSGSIYNTEGEKTEPSAHFTSFQINH
jgi:hypothetical protein